MPLPDPIRAKLSRAAAVRRSAGLFVDGGATTAGRLIDGAADGWSGVEIDVWGDHWIVSTRSPAWPDGLEFAVPEFCRSLWWRVLDRRDKRPPQPVAGTPPDPPLVVRELGLEYEIDLASGWSQGLFPDQREQRKCLMDGIRPGHSLLNLFCYTGAFSVAAAVRGALTTSIDLSQPYLDRTRRNLTRNGIDPASQHFCRGDVREWLPRFARKNRRWNHIVLDPPTFSRNAGGRVFRLQDDLAALVADCLRLLAPGGRLLVSTNDRGATAEFLTGIAASAAATAGIPLPVLTRGSMPPDFPGPAYLQSLWIARPD